MKIAFVLLALAMFPIVSFAEQYCQPPYFPPDPNDRPPIAELASEAAEVANDLVGSLACAYIQDYTFYLYSGIAEPPHDVTVGCYYSACPPDVNQGVIYQTSLWAGPDVYASVDHQGGWGQVWQVDIRFVTPAHIEGLTSLSIGVGGGGGAGSYGIVLTPPEGMLGCESFVQPGTGDWTPIVGGDAAFCITAEQPTPVGGVSWGTVRSLYR